MSDYAGIPAAMPSLTYELPLITLIAVANRIAFRGKPKLPSVNPVTPPVTMVAQPQARQAVNGCVPLTKAQVMGKNRMPSSGSSVDSECFLFWLHPEGTTPASICVLI